MTLNSLGKRAYSQDCDQAVLSPLNTARSVSLRQRTAAPVPKNGAPFAQDPDFTEIDAVITSFLSGESYSCLKSEEVERSPQYSQLADLLDSKSEASVAIPEPMQIDFDSLAQLFHSDSFSIPGDIQAPPAQIPQPERPVDGSEAYGSDQLITREATIGLKRMCDSILKLSGRISHLKKSGHKSEKNFYDSVKEAIKKAEEWQEDPSERSRFLSKSPYVDFLTQKQAADTVAAEIVFGLPRKTMLTDPHRINLNHKVSCKSLVRRGDLVLDPRKANSLITKNALSRLDLEENAS